MTENNSENSLKNFAKKYLAKHLGINSEDLADSSESGDFYYKGASYEAKISSPVITAKDKKSVVWDFDLRGSKWMNGQSVKIERESRPDFYVLLGIEEQQPKKVFLLPYSDAPISHVRISLTGNSKYYKYAI